MTNIGFTAPGNLRIFAIFIMMARFGYLDKRRQRQIAYVLVGSGVPSKCRAMA